MTNNLCFDVKRGIVDRPGLIMLNRYLFKKIVENEIYLKVLSCPDFKMAGISKSYYYYILEKLKEINLIKDGKINFKLLVSYTYDNKDHSIRIDPSFIFIGNNLMYVLDSRKRCNLAYELLQGLGIDDEKNSDLCKKVKKILSNILNQYLTSGVINVV